MRDLKGRLLQEGVAACGDFRQAAISRFTVTLLVRVGERE